MEVIYAYCPHCGMEWLDKIFLRFIGRYANGIFLECSECKGSIGPNNYEVEKELE